MRYLKTKIARIEEEAGASALELRAHLADHPARETGGRSGQGSARFDLR